MQAQHDGHETDIAQASTPEEDLWDQVTRLQEIVCQLLAKNQKLRIALSKSEQGSPPNLRTC
jgi:hypothetical protein